MEETPELLERLQESIDEVIAENRGGEAVLPGLEDEHSGQLPLIPGMDPNDAHRKKRVAMVMEANGKVRFHRLAVGAKKIGIATLDPPAVKMEFTPHETASKFWEDVAPAVQTGKVPSDLHIEAQLLSKTVLESETKERCELRFNADFQDEPEEKQALFEQVRKQADPYRKLREHFKPVKTINRLVEEKREAEQTGSKLQEDSFSLPETPVGGVPNISPSAFNQEYIPITGGPWTKQQYITDFLTGIAKAFWSFHHIPIAKAALKITHNFVWGRGVDIKFKNEKVQGFWDTWERDERFIKKFGRIILDGSVTGEIMIRYYAGKQSGWITFRSIDPSGCWEVITDPEDMELIYGFWFNYSTPYLIHTIDNVPITKYIVRTVDPREIDFLKFNVLTYERRGRSDLYTAETFLKWHYDTSWAKSVRAKAQNVWIWDGEVDGDQNDVNALLQSFPNPQNPGSLFIHNKNLKLQPLAPNLGTEPARSLVLDHLVTMVALATGVANEYLGVSSGGSRAGALLASEPFTKHVEERREFITELIESMVRRVLGAAIQGGLLKGDFKPDDLVPEVIWPSIVKEDLDKILKNLGLAVEHRWLSNEDAATTAAKEFGMRNYNFQETQEKIDEEIQEKQTGIIFNDQMPTPTPEGPMGAVAGKTGDSPDKKSGDDTSNRNVAENPMANSSAEFRRTMKQSQPLVIKFDLLRESRT